MIRRSMVIFGGFCVILIGVSPAWSLQALNPPTQVSQRIEPASSAGESHSLRQEDGTTSSADADASLPLPSEGAKAQAFPDGDTPEFSAAVSAFQEKHREYLTQVRQALQGSTNGYVGLWESHTRGLDADVQALIRQGINNYKSFDALRGRLSSVLEWQEVPATLQVNVGRCEGLPTFMCTERYELPPEDFKPIVLFKHRELASGTSVSVCQNAFLTVANYGYRLIRGEPYGVVKSAGGVVADRLLKEYPEINFCPSVDELIYVVIDLIDVGEPFPRALCVSGPQGHGRFVRILSSQFFPDAGQWKPGSYGGEWDGMSGWVYEAATHRLTLLRGDPPAEQVPVEQIDIRAEMLREAALLHLLHGREGKGQSREQAQSTPLSSTASNIPASCAPAPIQPVGRPKLTGKEQEGDASSSGPNASNGTSGFETALSHYDTAQREYRQLLDTVYPTGGRPSMWTKRLKISSAPRSRSFAILGP